MSENNIQEKKEKDQLPSPVITEQKNVNQVIVSSTDKKKAPELPSRQSRSFKQNEIPKIPKNDTEKIAPKPKIPSRNSRGFSKPPVNINENDQKKKKHRRSSSRRADEYLAQKNRILLNFTNIHLLKEKKPKITSFEELSNGNIFFYLLKSLIETKKGIFPIFSKREKNEKRLKSNKLIQVSNVRIILNYLQNEEFIELVGITGNNIVEKNIKFLSALLWRIILHFHIKKYIPLYPQQLQKPNQPLIPSKRNRCSKPSFNQTNPQSAHIENTSVYGDLCQWINEQIKEKYNSYLINCDKLSNLDVWNNGKLLYFLINVLFMKYNSNSKDINMNQKKKCLELNNIEKNYLNNNPLKLVDECIDFAEMNMDIPKIIETEDICVLPEQLSLITYLSFFRNYVDEMETKEKRKSVMIDLTMNKFDFTPVNVVEEEKKKVEEKEEIVIVEKKEKKEKKEEEEGREKEFQIKIKCKYGKDNKNEGIIEILRYKMNLYGFKKVKVKENVFEVKEYFVNTIDYTNVFCCHQLSKIPKKGSEKEEEERGDVDLGLVVGEVKYTKRAKSKMFLHRFVFPDITLENEKEYTIIMQQVVFFDRICPIEMGIGTYELLKKDRRLIKIIIDPHDGKKSAKSLFDKKIKPILDNGHLTYETVVLDSSEQMLDIAKSFEIKKYNEIAIVGGDRSVHNLIQGFMNHQKYNYKEVLKTVISVFAAGNSRILGSELGDSKFKSVKRAALICCKGKFTKLDLASVFKDGKRYFSFSQISFKSPSPSSTALGEISKVIGEIGKKFVSFDIKICRDGSLVKESPFYPVSKKKKDDEIVKSNIWNDVEKCNDDNTSKDLPECPFIKEHFFEELIKIAPDCVNEVAKAKSDIVSYTYELKNEKCLMLFLQNLRKVSNHLWGSSFSSFNNGQMDLLMITQENVKKKQFFKLFRKMMKWDMGDHINDQLWRGYRAKSFYVKPVLTDEKVEKTTGCIDGKTFELSPVIVEVHQKVLNVMKL